MNAFRGLWILPLLAAPLAGQARPARPGMTTTNTAPPLVAPPPAIHIAPLPDTSGWGVHILALARGPDGAIWVGTYGDGIFVLRPGRSEWQSYRADTTQRSISSSFVHAFGFHGHDVWYGTVGNGWGVIHDDGTFERWEGRQLGPRWQYVVPNGIVVRGDTVFIATADGIRWTASRGQSWSAITDTVPVRGLPSRYVLSMAPARDGGLWVATLHGLGTFTGGAFHAASPSPTPLGGRVRSIFVIHASGAVVPAILGSETCIGSQRPKRRKQEARWECMSLLQRAGGASVRALGGCDGVLCAGASSTGAFYGARLGLALQPRNSTARSRDVYAVLPPPAQTRIPADTLFGTACGFLGQQPEACLAPGDTAGVRPPATPLHTWFARPIARTEQPFIDQTYRFGSTMGGFFQPHQGVEFNNPTGTPVQAIDAGIVVHAGPAEQGALVVAIRHDSMLNTPQGRRHIYSVYYHNSELLVSVGQRVQRGQIISRVGHTGRATNDHMHLEVHASPYDSTRLIVDPAVRYPPFNTNPELWIEPMPGTGLVVGQVWDASGSPVRQARIYGIVKPEPQETPFSFAETYGERNHSDPVYQEHFAVGDVPAGEYVLGTTIDGRKVFKRIRVEAGKMTFVEFR